MSRWTYLSDLIFPWVIVAAGVILLIWQARVWTNISQRPAEPDLTFFRRRFLRRTQISFLLIVLGFFLLGGRAMFSNTQHPVWALGYWGLTAILTLWLVVLAAGDLLVGFYHFSQLKHKSDLEQLRLTLLADKLKRVHGNGKHSAFRSTAPSGNNNEGVNSR